MLNLAIIGGRVVDERGVPVPGALVGASGSDDRSVGRSNSDGRFSLGIVAGEPVRVMARKPGFVLAIRSRVRPWTDDLKIVLSRGASVAGRVVARPLPRRIRIKLVRWEGEERVRARMGSVLCLPGGLFTITRLPAGLYEVSAEAKGWETESPVMVDAAPGEHVAGIEIRLVRR